MLPTSSSVDARHTTTAGLVNIWNYLMKSSCADVTATKLQTQMQTPHHISGTRNHLGIADA
jgi:hypothetical protein